MSRAVHHRDGSKTVWFANGKKATFGRPPAQRRQAEITGTPYVFTSGSKITLPSGVAHGMIFEHRNKLYVAMRYSGQDAAGRQVRASYGQPIKLTRPL